MKTPLNKTDQILLLIMCALLLQLFAMLCARCSQPMTAAQRAQAIEERIAAQPSPAGRKFADLKLP